LLSRSEFGLAIGFILAFLTQSDVKLTHADALPAGQGFLAAHGAAYFANAAFSGIHEHVAAERAIPEFRAHHKQSVISFREVHYTT